MSSRNVWFAVIILLAVLVALAGYYLVHKPITPALAVHLTSVAADVGVALWITLLGGGLGRVLLSHPLLSALLRLPRAGEGVGGEVALGWGVIALLTLALGFFGGLHAPVMWALALTGTVLLRSALRAWAVDVWAAVRELWEPGRFARGCAMAVGVILLLGLLRALAPPMMWDALVYHLTLPRQYIELHGLNADPRLVFTGMPQLNEMLFTTAMLLRGSTDGITAQTLGWAFGAVLVVTVAGYARSTLGSRESVFAPAMLLSSFTVALSFAWAYAELLLMLYAVGVLIALREWQQTHNPRWLVLAGALSAFAVGCKYTGVIVPIAAAAFVLFATGRNLQPATRNIAILLVPCALLTAPWLLKNLLATGNPFYPLLLPTAPMDALRQSYYNHPSADERNPLWASLIFFRAVFLGLQGGNDYDATLGPLWVLMPLLAALGWRRLSESQRHALAPIAMFCAAGYVVWVALKQVSKYAVQARLFFAMFPALAVLGAAGLSVLPSFNLPQLRLAVVVRAIIAFVLAVNVREVALHFAGRSPLVYLAGVQNADDYRLAQLGGYTLALQRVNALPAEARVLFLWEPRSLECVTIERCLPDTIIDRWWHARRTVGSAQAILSGWRVEGVTHVLLAETGIAFVKQNDVGLFTAADWDELQRLRDQLTLVEHIGPAYTLYALP
ncbi:MAG: ArnT family glycosyltransferase [Anaerolineales bacterium]